MGSPNELESLLHKLFDNSPNSEFDDTDAHALEELLDSSAEARRLYFDFVNVQLAMMERAEIDSHTTESVVDPSSQSCEIVGQSLLAPRRSKRIWIGYVLAAAACLLVGVLLRGFLRQPEGLEREEVTANTEQALPTDRDALGVRPQNGAIVPSRYVAEISSESSDVEWGAGGSSREFLLRLRAGDRLELNQGLVRIDYFSGASLILKGPSVFLVTGYESGRLESGELTGEVTIGKFALTTPSAKVIDLGTAFGVSVDGVANTDVCVFDGEVSLSAEDESGSFSEPMLLTVGMSARATRQGRISTDVEIDLDRFARRMPLPPSVEMTGGLSLVDVVNGYDHHTFRLAAGIAPDTGQAYQQEWFAANEAYPRSRKGTYHVTNWHPMVDGVFIPESSGRSVQIDSAGRTVALVKNGANTSGPIWSRRRIDDPSRIVFHENFWGGATLERVLERLGACEWGMIGLHANVGITFDLNSIRSMYAENPIRFRTVIANLDNSDEHRPGKTDEKRFVADFRLLVDGKLRRSRLGFGRTDGDLFISIPLRDTDRFLTIVTTDAGHYWYDQVVLIDPLLEFAEPQ